MHTANKELSDKFNNGWKKMQNCRFIAIFRISRQWFYLVGAISSTVYHVSSLNLSCSVEFNNGGGLFLSVLLFIQSSNKKI